VLSGKHVTNLKTVEPLQTKINTVIRTFGGSILVAIVHCFVLLLQKVTDIEGLHIKNKTFSYKKSP
jgi:hypothetical protein